MIIMNPETVIITTQAITIAQARILITIQNIRAATEPEAVALPLTIGQDIIITIMRIMMWRQKHTHHLQLALQFPVFKTPDSPPTSVAQKLYQSRLPRKEPLFLKRLRFTRYLRIFRL